MPVMAGVVHDEGALVAEQNLRHLKLSLDQQFSEDDFHKAIRTFLTSYNVRFTRETFEELLFRYTWWSQPNNMTARKEEYIAVSLGDTFPFPSLLFSLFACIATLLLSAYRCCRISTSARGWT